MCIRDRLGSAEITGVVRDWLSEQMPPVVVLDPVMIATSGDRLLAPDAERAVRDLVAMAGLVTPNLPELAVLIGEPEARTWTDALDQGRRLAGSSGTTVLVKGGHLTGTDCPDALVAADGAVVEVRDTRVATDNTHGTGCSLSAAMATRRAATGSWEQALREVKPWLRGALERAASLRVGTGHGPIHHFHHLPAPQPPLPTDPTETRNP